MGLTLNAAADIKKSEDFITLNAQKDAYLTEVQLGLASYAISAHALNCKDAHVKVLEAFCHVITGAARGFIAQLNIEHYSEHQAVMDLLALKTDECTAFLNTHVSDILRHYKIANDLTVLPIPSVPFNFRRALEFHNGLTPAQANAGTEAPPPPLKQQRQLRLQAHHLPLLRLQMEQLLLQELKLPLLHHLLGAT